MIREEDVLIPDEQTTLKETTLKEGDRLIVFTPPEKHGTAKKYFLTPTK